jgi:dTDP-4-amino-4,6-dideoxygalactose transaminase
MSRPPRTEFLVFGQPQILEPEIEEVLDSLRKCWLGTGPKVARFKRDFAAHQGVEHVAAVNSCTAALHLSCIAAGLKPGDEVITTAMTFCATINAIIHSGATPILVDCDRSTMNITTEGIATSITPRTRVIVPVHFGGRPCDIVGIVALAEKHGLKVIEDCAHAIETEIAGRKAGTFGDFATFSFYATKNVVTGEGGMIVARRPEDASRLERLALHGMSDDAWKRFSDVGFKHYQVAECGFKYNMMDLQAAIGIHQLARVNRCWERRRAIWARYQAELADLPLTLPAEPEQETRHAFHLYTILVDQTACGLTRDSFLEEMTRRRIGVGVHYLSIPEHPYYSKTFGWRPEDYPNAYHIGRRTVSLPISPKLTDDDVSDVVDAVRSILRRG